MCVAEIKRSLASVRQRDGAGTSPRRGTHVEPGLHALIFADGCVEVVSTVVVVAVGNVDFREVWDLNEGVAVSVGRGQGEDGEMHYEEASTCTFPTTLATTENNTVKSHGRRQRKANESYDDWEHTMRRKMSPMRERRFQSARRARRSARSCRWRLTTSCGAWFSGGQLIASIADIPLAFERGGTRRGGERAYGHIAEEVAYLLGGHRRRLGVLLCLARKRLHEDRETSAQTVKVRVLRLDDLLHDVRALLGLRVHWVT